MRIIGCDLHARQQTSAMLDTAMGEVVNETLAHEGEGVRKFYSRLPGPVRVGIEATCSRASDYGAASQRTYAAAMEHWSRQNKTRRSKRKATARNVCALLT